jgi:hypothetical protein
MWIALSSHSSACPGSLLSRKRRPDSRSRSRRFSMCGIFQLLEQDSSLLKRCWARSCLFCRKACLNQYPFSVRSLVCERTNASLKVMYSADSAIYGGLTDCGDCSEYPINISCSPAACCRTLEARSRSSDPVAR